MLTALTRWRVSQGNRVRNRTGGGRHALDISSSHSYRGPPVLTPSVSPASSDATAIEVLPQRDLAPTNGGGSALQTPKEWGGPHLEWKSLQDPEASAFVLDNPAEKADWEGFCTTIRDATNGLCTSLSLLNSAALAFKVDRFASLSVVCCHPSAPDPGFPCRPCWPRAWRNTGSFVG